MTKVAIYVAHFPPITCGVGDYTFQLVDHLRRIYNSDISVYSHTKNINGYPYQKQIEINSIGSMLNFARTLKKEGVAVLLIEYQAHSFQRQPYPNLLIMYLRLFTNITPILVMHDFAGPIVSRFMPELVSRGVNVLTGMFARAIVVTDTLRLEKFLRYDILKIVTRKVLHIPVGSNILVATPISLENVRKDICFFGLVQPAKNVDKLILSFFDIIKHPDHTDLKLYIIGESADLEYSSHLVDLVNTAECQDRVIFTGNLESSSISYLLQRMKICVLPYQKGLYFTTSTAVTACMYHRLPMIGTTQKTDTFFPGVLTIPLPLQKEHLVTAISRLMSDHKFYEKLTNELDQVMESYSWENICLQFKTLIMNVTPKTS